MKFEYLFGGSKVEKVFLTKFFLQIFVTFELLNGFSIFKRLNDLKFHQKSIENVS